MVKRINNCDLPSRDGLAFKLASNSQLNQHNAVIFTDDFKEGERGPSGTRRTIAGRYKA
ncbi:hypothetical protein RMSM_04707 [Rhodopirellula maiorica SM1]|uniref:Uncharacterized protein n=1 Tax=Rhodopirellula maiorica SM1 TaxID=1265738 RepID=M5RGW4_9BACT|nr:hypothetical protein RMSM_04707 [Rhodopirellula maiorica SM1]